MAETNVRNGLNFLSHRGPDGSNVARGDKIAFGHTRLALVDLDNRSNQPFLDESGRFCLVFNGEIYNFKKIARSLAQGGVEFRTKSDTEVVLKALMCSDDVAETVRQFEGMFAFAFHDKQTGQTILARDRFGMKPLYVSVVSDTYYFASEAKALGEFFSLEPDILTTSAFLMGDGGPMRGPTFYQNVETLQPGALVTIDGKGKIDASVFFQVTDFLNRERHAELASMSPTQIVDHFEEKLLSAVDSHLFADARVGAFCSGGVDSSLLVAMSAKLGKNIELFHSNVLGSWSELDAAQALANHLKLNLHKVDVADQEFLELMPDVAWHYEQPFMYHPNCPPMMLVTKLARDTGVKGLLSGEGSDELFLGYPWLGRKKLTDSWAWIRSKMARSIRAIPAVGDIVLPDESGTFAEARDLFAALCDREDIQTVSSHLLTSGIKDQTVGWTLQYMHHHLRSLLHRNDTMGMAGSIEARFPFLDNSFVADAVNLPGRFKLRKSPLAFEKAHPFIRDKWVVRQIADRYIPKDLSNRTKLGFWTSVFKRLELDPAYFRGSPVCDMFRITENQMIELVSTSSYEFRLRLLHTDVWLRSTISREAHSSQTNRLRTHVQIKSERGRM